MKEKKNDERKRRARAFIRHGPLGSLKHGGENRSSLNEPCAKVKMGIRAKRQSSTSSRGRIAERSEIDGYFDGINEGRDLYSFWRITSSLFIIWKYNSLFAVNL